MSTPIACPVCTLEDVVLAKDHHECVTCGHRWPRAEADAKDDEGPRVVKDANGNVLRDGDDVVLVKDLKLKGGGGTLKGGTKVKRIRIVDGDHEIDCKVDGVGMLLKACFLKKA